MAQYDRRYIEWLKEQDPATLTPEQKRLRNLTPMKPGETLNPNGAKKGTKHWSVYVRQLLDDEKLFSSFVKSVPKELDPLIDKSSAKAIMAALIISATRASLEKMAKGEKIDRDTREMISLLNKIGFGDKVVFEADDSFFNKANLTFNVVPDRESEVSTEE